MGPISQAIEAISAAQKAMREHGLVTNEECNICYRMLGRGVHGEGCPYEALNHARRRLLELQSELTT